jgi:hypothetical protein
MTLFAMFGVFASLWQEPSVPLLLVGTAASDILMAFWHRQVWHSSCSWLKWVADMHGEHHLHPENLKVDSQDVLALLMGWLTWIMFLVATRSWAFAAGTLLHFALSLLVHDEMGHGRASFKSWRKMGHPIKHHGNPTRFFSVLWVELWHMAQDIYE